MAWTGEGNAFPCGRASVPANPFCGGGAPQAVQELDAT